jgi:hypothetical protein
LRHAALRACPWEDFDAWSVESENALTRGLSLLAREIAHEAAPRGHGLRRRVSLGRRLHGRYIGLIRNLPRQQKARVRAARARKGVEAAIRMARKLRGSR